MAIKKTILEKLLRAVEEVINNNDWPAEAGKCDEDGNCEILDLVNEIRKGY